MVCEVHWTWTDQMVALPAEQVMFPVCMGGAPSGRPVQDALLKSVNILLWEVVSLAVMQLPWKLPLTSLRLVSKESLESISSPTTNTSPEPMGMQTSDVSPLAALWKSVGWVGL